MIGSDQYSNPEVRNISTRQLESNILDSFYDSSFTTVKSNYKRKKLRDKLTSIHESISVDILHSSRKLKELTDSRYLPSLYSINQQTPNKRSSTQQGPHVRFGNFEEISLQAIYAPKSKADVILENESPTETPSVQNLLQTILRSYTEISEIVSEFQHKKAVANRLEHANKTIMRSVEQIISEVHTMYRRKIKVNETRNACIE